MNTLFKPGEMLHVRHVKTITNCNGPYTGITYGVLNYQTKEKIIEGSEKEVEIDKINKGYIVTKYGKSFRCNIEGTRFSIISPYY